MTIVVTGLILVLAAIGAAVDEKDGEKSVAAGSSSTSAPEITEMRVPADMLNPAVTQATIADTVCRAGYSDTIRPSSTATSALKSAQIRAYGYADPDPAKYQHDHVIALALGGSADAPVNLFPEPLALAQDSDGLERNLHSQVCSGRTPLAAAQAQLLAAKTVNGFDRTKSEAGGVSASTAAPTVATTAAPATSPVTTVAPASPGTTAVSIYYANCAAVRAAGAAPLYSGSAGYRAALDSDDDGIACE